MRSLSGKIAVVTGASLGIGRAISIALGREGCTVVLVARNKEGLQETQRRIETDGGNAIVVPTDLASLHDIEELNSLLVTKFSHVDILWNGAFGWLDGPIESTENADIINFIDGSVRGTILVTKILMPLLLSADGAHVINVSADWEFPEVEGLTPFIAAKRAIAGMGIALQKEKAGSLRVTNLHPGDVASKTYDIDDDISEVLIKNDNHMIPLREVADLVVFLLKLEGTILHQVNLKPLIQEIGTSFL